MGFVVSFKERQFLIHCFLMTLNTISMRNEIQTRNGGLSKYWIQSLSTMQIHDSSYGRDSTQLVNDLRDDYCYVTDSGINTNVEISEADLFEQRVQVMRGD